MLTPKLTDVLRRTTPALAIGVTLGLSGFSLSSNAQSLNAQSLNVQSSWALAQGFPDSSLSLTTESYFRPPRNPRSSGPRTTTGTRSGSCVGDPTTAFTTFGPDSVVGYTAAARPEFVWYLPPSEQSFPVTFRLLAPNEIGIPEPIHTAQLAYMSGFSTYQLPPEVPTLRENQEYRWQIIVECDPASPARSLAQELSFEVVPLPAALSQMSATATPVEKARAYAAQGLWYDAIAQIAQATTPNAKQTRTRLLQDLAESEPENKDRYQNLLNIAAAFDGE